jgi:hypothetical protein
MGGFLILNSPYLCIDVNQAGDNAVINTSIYICIEIINFFLSHNTIEVIYLIIMVLNILMLLKF